MLCFMYKEHGIFLRKGPCLRPIKNTNCGFELSHNQNTPILEKLGILPYPRIPLGLQEL